MTSTPPAASLPTWDMTGLVIATDPAGLVQAGIDLAAAVDALVALYDAHGVGDGAAASAVSKDVVETILQATNTTFLHAGRVEQIVECLAAADTTDAAVLRAGGHMRVQRGRLNLLESRFNRWTAGLDLARMAIESAPVAAHAYPLRQRQRLARQQMSPDAEEITAALGSVGGKAWSQLRDAVEAGIVGQIEIDGVLREVGVGEFQEFLTGPDRDLRRRAFEAQTAAYARVAIPLAAVVNAVKGETLLLTERRGWPDPLEPMLIANGIDQEILDALLTSVRAAQPTFQRYLRALATALGLPRLAVYDLGAPVGSRQSWSFATAVAFITAQFADASPALGAIANRAVQERWIDAGPRRSKIDGAFCSTVGKGESRILLNFAPTYVGMSTLAHELGHAYHVAVLSDRQRAWLQVFPPPMTLAETASTFCEVLVQQAARRNATPNEELAILGGWLLTAMSTIFGTHSVFNLEQAIFAARRDHELSVEELNRLAVDAQLGITGDAVTPFETSFLWTMWHLGQPDIWHYTFPYIFGLLFGLGLFREFQQSPDTFFARFDDLLADVSLADASTLASRFGIDLRNPAFWQEGLAVLEADVASFEELVAAGT